eukprot:TRINITY_DN6018_c0_g1_i3.p1 TRINITY_DN6018_c0_g1~~TRINITY_DN6018_c0_g1_i3.p1  ORF type:complete len:505 (-),score=83.37 TRINITY_DN6018_c0_g1_i3:782-2296(-)
MSTTLKLGHYRLGKTVGVGSFSKVKTAVHETTTAKVAVKVINRRKVKTADLQEKIKREIQILKHFSHPHIIRLYDVISTPTDIFLVMEYVPHGELFEFIVTNGKMPEENARRFFQQIISAVDYCHQKNIVHRDLKPENILLDINHDVKIVDFGLSNILADGEFLRTSCGSPNYAAPEVIAGNLYSGPEVDIWSCGVILYALLCGRLPFDDEFIPNLFKKIKSGIFHLPGYLSDGARDLVSKMLCVSPLSRATIADIKSHPWYDVQIPAYLHIYQKQTPRDTQIDDDALQSASRALDMTPETIRRSLLNSENERSKEDQNHIAVTYQLLYDQKLRSIMENSKKGEDAGSKTPEEVREVVSIFEKLPMDSTLNLKSLSPSATLPTSSQINGTTHGKQAQHAYNRVAWTAGFRSTLHPTDLMVEVYRVLKSCKFEWKVVHPYEIRCKGDFRYHGAHVPIKLGIRVFKVDEMRCQLDFYRISGSPVAYMDTCYLLVSRFTLEAFRAPI